MAVEPSNDVLLASAFFGFVSAFWKLVQAVDFFREQGRRKLHRVLPECVDAGRVVHVGR